MDDLRAKFITWHEKHFNAFWPGNPTHEERWVTWQAATEATKATGTAGEQTKQSFEKIEELKLPTHLVNLQRYAPVVLMDGTMPTMKADNSGTWLNAYNVADACVQDAGRTNQLPPLPESLNDVKAMMRGEPEWLESCDDYYTQHQMREYGQACAEAARQPAPVVACTCPSGDGSLRWPCPQHPQLPVAITDKTGPNGIKWYVEPNLPDGVNLYIKEQK